MIEYFKRIDKKQKVRKIESPLKDSLIKCINPTAEEMDLLIKRFKLKKDLILDGLDIYENPRVEQEKGIIYLFLRSPILSEAVKEQLDQEPSSSFLIIITKDNMTIISKADLKLFEKIINSKNFFTNNRSLTTLLILSSISKIFGNSVREIMKSVKRDKSNIHQYSEKELNKLVTREDSINDYLSSFSPLIDINKQIVGIKSLRFTDKEKEFIEDLAVDLNQTLNTCNNALKSITNTRGYYTVTLTNKLNKTMTLLTFFTVFLTIPTMMFSLYGMNISLPLQTHPFVFPILISTIVILWICMIFVLKKMKII
jgi:magnesium transporter